MLKFVCLGALAGITPCYEYPTSRFPIRRENRANSGDPQATATPSLLPGILSSVLTFLRQLARAITGKVDAFEFALGIFFGLFLGLVPATEIDLGSGFLGLNGLWLLGLLACLVLKASLALVIVSALAAKLLAIAFLDRAAHALGQAVLDGAESMAVGFVRAVPSWQLHTYWGFGTAVLGLALGGAAFAVVYPLFRKHLPAWRERFGQTRLAKALGSFFVFKALGRLIS